MCTVVNETGNWILLLKSGHKGTGSPMLGPNSANLLFGKDLVARNEDCQARKLNKEDAMDRCKWRKMIKEAR